MRSRDSGVGKEQMENLNLVLSNSNGLAAESPGY